MVLRCFIRSVCPESRQARRIVYLFVGISNSEPDVVVSYLKAEELLSDARIVMIPSKLTYQHSLNLIRTF